MSRLVSLLVMDYCSKLGLEVDLTDMQRRMDRMTRKAETDPLILVENKASFEKKAQARLDAWAGASALLVIDVDHFKTVNDIFGRQFGDNYLRSIADALQNTFPRGTLIGRVGGDEFSALIDLPVSVSGPHDGRELSIEARKVQFGPKDAEIAGAFLVFRWI